MTVPYWKTAEPANTDTAHPGAQPVNEQHALPIQIYLRPDGSQEYQLASISNPLPTLPQGPNLFYNKVPISADVSWQIALSGYVFVAADADQNDRVTGQTSFANTTPTFLLRNPSTSIALVIPFYYQLAQTGTVAGGDIAVETEIIYPDAYASGGTSEKITRLRPGMASGPLNHWTLNTGATATAGYGSAIGHVTLAADVSGAEGIINIYEWQAPSGVILDPQVSLNVFTSAATTGPTWGYHFVAAEFLLAWL